MYVGRIVAVGRTKAGRVAALYRVSSRSFPNRIAKTVAGGAIIVPKQGFQDDVYKNPYIAYSCLKIVGNVAVASNGSQTDPIAEKVAAGVPVRDAMATALLALDYEKDNYSTPRVVSAVARGAETGFLGIVRKDGLHVREIPLPAGKVFYIATYETNDVDLSQTGDFDVQSAAEGAKFVMDGGVFAGLELPVTAVCALATANGFEIAANPE
jgi:IMP cyclohydrolase